MSFRVGIGYDAHRLVEGRRLVLGGVHIPFEKGLEGHSDADVIIHAVIDALLGAGNLGNIGQLFPDTDPQFKDVSSLKLLEHVNNLLRDHRWKVCNVDITVVAQRPRLSPYISDMQKALSLALTFDIANVSVKPKTTEKLGFTGREEGIEAYAVALLESTAGISQSR